MQITVYPKCYDEMMPYFSLDIDYTKIRCGPVKSRSRENVFGVVWSGEKKKKCRIFIAFESRTDHEKFEKYFSRKLLKFFNNNCENGKWILMTIIESTNKTHASHAVVFFFYRFSLILTNLYEKCSNKLSLSPFSLFFFFWYMFLGIPFFVFVCVAFSPSITQNRKF